MTSRRQSHRGRRAASGGGPQPWKLFQLAVADALKGAKASGLIRDWNAMEDGLRFVRTPDGQGRAVAATPQPSDFIATTPDNGIVVLEAKRCAEPRLPVARLKGFGEWAETSGVKGHQIEWLTRCDSGAGVGLLLVELPDPSGIPHVWSLRGRALAAHLQQFPDRASIPMAYFEQAGRRLGPRSFWRLEAQDLLPHPKAPV